MQLSFITFEPPSKNASVNGVCNVSNFFLTSPAVGATEGSLLLLAPAVEAAPAVGATEGSLLVLAPAVEAAIFAIEKLIRKSLAELLLIRCL